MAVADAANTGTAARLAGAALQLLSRLLEPAQYESSSGDGSAHPGHSGICGLICWLLEIASIVKVGPTSRVPSASRIVKPAGANSQATTGTAKSAQLAKNRPMSVLSKSSRLVSAAMRQLSALPH